MSDLTNWLAGVVDPEPPPEPQIPADYLWKCPRRGRFRETKAPKDSQLMLDSASGDSEGVARTTFGRKLRERSLAPPSDSIEDDVNEGISRGISKLRFADPPVETTIISRTKDLREAVRPLFTKLKFNANHSSGVVALEVKAKFNSAPENEDEESEVVEQCISTKKHYLSEGASLEEYVILKNVRAGSAKCKVEALDEPSWNSLVNSAMLQQAVRGLEDVDFYDITRALVIKDLVPDTKYDEEFEQKLITYAITLGEPAFSTKTLIAFLNAYEQLPALRETVGPSDYVPLQLQPIFILINTVRSGGSPEDGRLRLYLWAMAHFSRMRKLSRTDMVPVIVPLIPAMGESWSAMFAVDYGEEIRVYDGVPLGDTSTILGCYRVLKGLRLTIEWAKKHFKE